MIPNSSPMYAGALQVGVAAAGSVEIKGRLLRSIATQSVVEAHETALKKPPPSLPLILAPIHVGVAAVGLVEVTTRPLLPTATHSEFEEHEIPHTYGLGPVSAPVASAGPGDNTPAKRTPANSATNPHAQSRLALLPLVCPLRTPITPTQTPDGPLSCVRAVAASRTAIPRLSNACPRQLHHVGGPSFVGHHAGSIPDRGLQS